MNCHIPEALKPVRCLAPLTMAAIATGDYISLKNVEMVFIVANLTQGNAAVQDFKPLQATKVDGTGAKALTNSVPVWSNLDEASADLMVKRTDGTTYATDAAVKHKSVVFQIDPTSLDSVNDFDCLGLECASSHADNILSVQYFCKMRYAEDQAPAVITD